MRSILFVAFSGSEAGQFGAHHFTEEPIWALPKIAGALHLDQLGVAATGAGSVRIGATPGFSDRSFSSLGRDAHALAKELDLSVTVNSTWTGGDNYFLAQKDVAVAALRGRPGIAKPDEEDASQDESPGYDFEQLAMITRLAYWTGFQAANSESPPTRLGTRTGWDK